MFSDGWPIETAARAVWCRMRGRSWWHNRVFTFRQSIDRTADGFLVRWRGRGEVLARSLSQLACRGPRGVIVASGPSVTQLERPERLFELPVACVNGSVSLPSRLGCRCDYLVVSDPRFIRDQPELFRTGVAVADAIVLNPTALFAALQFVPGALDEAAVYLAEDVLRPFKQPRPSPAAIAADPRLLVHPSGRIAFSLDPAHGICSAGTVVYNTVQLLFGIGYEEVFMFGADFSAEPRFYTERAPAASELADSFASSIEPAFQLVGDSLRRSGKRLVNASASSRLSATDIPKADGNDVLERICREPV